MVSDASAAAHPFSLATARRAQQEWSQTPVTERLRIVRRLRAEIATSSADLCPLFSRELFRTDADSLTAEIIPLAEACRFLELSAGKLLAPQRVSRAGRPFWLGGVEVHLHREPLGVVLIVGPRNYPLFLPGVQTLQALVAGNSVALKPGAGGRSVAQALHLMALSAGLPEGLLQVLDEAPETAVAVIRSGVDQVVLTGSVDAGEAVYRVAAEHMTPVIMELSGNDPVFIQRDAEVAQSVRALAFGLKLNGGLTCIAPRRVFVAREIAGEFERELSARFAAQKLARGSLSIRHVESDDEALLLAADTPFALGATVFGNSRAAYALAARINAGIVVVNDMIVPTADPRVPFGGRQRSGFGTTRGGEGLLAMTALKAVVVQRARRLRHLETQPHNAAEIFRAYLTGVHASGWRQRLDGWRALARALTNGKRKEACRGSQTNP